MTNKGDVGVVNYVANQIRLMLGCTFINILSEKNLIN